jgi:hypothetical protein
MRHIRSEACCHHDHRPAVITVPPLSTPSLLSLSVCVSASVVVGPLLLVRVAMTCSVQITMLVKFVEIIYQ